MKHIVKQLQHDDLSPLDKYALLGLIKHFELTQSFEQQYGTESVNRILEWKRQLRQEPRLQ